MTRTVRINQDRLPPETRTEPIDRDRLPVLRLADQP